MATGKCFACQKQKITALFFRCWQSVYRAGERVSQNTFQVKLFCETLSPEKALCSGKCFAGKRFAEYFRRGKCASRNYNNFNFISLRRLRCQGFPTLFGPSEGSPPRGWGISKGGRQGCTEEGGQSGSVGNSECLGAKPIGGKPARPVDSRATHTVSPCLLLPEGIAEAKRLACSLTRQYLACPKWPVRTLKARPMLTNVPAYSGMQHGPS